MHSEAKKKKKEAERSRLRFRLVIKMRCSRELCALRYGERKERKKNTIRFQILFLFLEVTSPSKRLRMNPSRAKRPRASSTFTVVPQVGVHRATKKKKTKIGGEGEKSY